VMRDYRAAYLLQQAGELIEKGISQ
jgi:hypothetical protein